MSMKMPSVWRKWDGKGEVKVEGERESGEKTRKLSLGMEKQGIHRMLIKSQL